MNFETLNSIVAKFEKLKGEQLEVDPNEKAYLSISFGSNTLGKYHYSMCVIYRRKYLRLKFEGYPTQLNEVNTASIETFQDVLNALENSEFVESTED